MLDEISQAILDRRLLSFRYDGLPRLVEPHACGQTAKLKPVLRGYQPAGGTSREHGFKLFSISKIEELQVLNMTFDSPREGYKMNDSQIPFIEAQLAA